MLRSREWNLGSTSSSPVTGPNITSNRTMTYDMMTRTTTVMRNGRVNAVATSDMPACANRLPPVPPEPLRYS